MPGNTFATGLNDSPAPGALHVLFHWDSVPLEATFAENVSAVIRVHNDSCWPRVLVLSGVHKSDNASSTASIRPLVDVFAAHFRQCGVQESRDQCILGLLIGEAPCHEVEPWLSSTGPLAVPCPQPTTSFSSTSSSGMLFALAFSESNRLWNTCPASACLALFYSQHPSSHRGAVPATCGVPSKATEWFEAMWLISMW